jgi:Phospholipase_D-nuclease N-terminal
MEGVVLFVIVLWASFVAFWIWALVDAIQVPEDRFYQSGTKIVWVLVIVLTGAIGAIIYLAAGRPDPATRATMKHQGHADVPPAPIPPRPPGSR